MDILILVMHVKSEIEALLLLLTFCCDACIHQMIDMNSVI